MMSLDLLQAVKQYIPNIVVIMCIFGICFGMLMVILLSMMDGEKKAKDKTHEHIKQRRARDLKESFESLETEHIPFFSDYIAAILAKIGAIRVGPIIASFFQVMRILKASTFKRHWRYRLPLYLVIGPEKSGKSAMLNGLSFMHLAGENKINENVWHLFDNGVLFEVPANIFFDKETKFWKFLLHVFSYFRPRRPVDGVILTVPADILGRNHSTDISQYARETVFKMTVLQKELNFRVPIYVVITKSDVISGFSAFCTELDPSEKGQIIGWSSKDNIDAEIKKNMVNEALNEISIGLRRAALLFARDKRVSPVLKNAIFIKTSMDSIAKDLEDYISILLNQADKDLFLCLRGLYFVSMNTNEVTETSRLETAALNPDNIENRQTSIHETTNMHRGVCFADDLFREKIFREMNLARPLDMSTLQVSKQTWMKRGAAIVLSVAWSIAWYVSNEAIMREVKSAERILRNAVGLLRKINVIEDDVRDQTDQQILKQETKKMLQLISNISKDNLYSIFVPASWFSNVKTKISSVVGLLFDSSATRTVFLDLNLNAKLAGHEVMKGHGFVKAQKNPFDVTSVQSFNAFKTFVHKVIKLEKMEVEYNRIRKLDDPEAINLITNEIFQETFDVTHMLKDRPQSSRYTAPKFNLEQFQDQLINDAATLFNQFLDDIFNDTINLVFQKLCEDIERLLYTAQNNQEPYTYQELAQLYGKLETLTKLTSSSSFSWLRENFFKPTDEYIVLISNIETSKILGHKVASLLADIANEKFSALKNTLLQHKTSITGSIFADSTLKLSKGFYNFKNELKAIVDEIVINQEFQKEFVNNIPADQVLVWDPNIVSEAIAIINKYHNFIEGKSKKFREQYRETYASIIRKIIYPGVVATLARAQNLDDVLSGTNQQLESAIRKQAINLRSISGYVSKIALFFDEYTNRGSGDCGFAELIIEQANSILNVVDALFAVQSPYSVGQGVFSQWNGLSGPNFGTGSESNDIKQYLNSQYQRMRFLSKELAAPAIEILSAPGIEEKVSNFDKKTKWDDILRQVQAFENNIPGNSIAALEEFMARISENASVQTLKNDIAINNASNQSGDYFINQRAKIAKALMNRASDITLQQAYNEYNTIAAFFNSQLAGRFPFDVNSQMDCTLNDIKNFVEVCTTLNNDTINILKRNASKYNIPMEALNFLDGLPVLINFLNTLVTHNIYASADSAVMAFKVESRANIDHEVFGNIISERSLLINGVSQDEDSEIIIHNGDTIEAELPFVMVDGNVELNVNPDQEISVNGDKVLFSYSGDWNILKLILRHKSSTGPEGTLLEFSVPIISQGEEAFAKIYMRIKSYFREQGGNWMPLAFPVFPKSAPSLPTINF